MLVVLVFLCELKVKVAAQRQRFSLIRSEISESCIQYFSTVNRTTAAQSLFEALTSLYM